MKLNHWLLRQRARLGLWIAAGGRSLPCGYVTELAMDLDNPFGPQHHLFNYWAASASLCSLFIRQSRECNECDRPLASPLSGCSDRDHLEAVQLIKDAIAVGALEEPDVFHALEYDGLVPEGIREGWLSNA